MKPRLPSVSIALLLVVRVASAVMRSPLLTQSFDWPSGNTSIWLSASAYCDRSEYMVILVVVYRYEIYFEVF